MIQKFIRFAIGLSLLAGTFAIPAYAAPANLCALFTVGDMKSLLGTDVDAGEPAAMGTGCQWFGKDEQSYVIIQRVGPGFWIDPRQAPGYEVILNLGKRAYSHPDSEGGWRAMALTADATLSVVMIGKTATRANTVSLIRQLSAK
ncbi:hypothetical protein YTPLAS18_22300 [Nitrospira sp.]|nr:hypothetical protein YTPLAS18_22300 [Nitrospira sp.]